MRLLNIACVCAFLAGCGSQGESPEDVLRRWVADAQFAAENEDRSALLGMLSENYTDARGNDLKAVDQMLRFYFLRQDSVVLISNIEDIVINGETAAIVTLTAGMAGANDAAFGFSADAYRFELELERDGDEWLLIAARWGELGQKVR
jgi:hypothetical protein